MAGDPVLAREGAVGHSMQTQAHCRVGHSHRTLLAPGALSPGMPSLVAEKAGLPNRATELRQQGEAAAGGKGLGSIRLPSGRTHNYEPPCRTRGRSL